MENAKKFFEEIVKTEEAKALFLAIEAPETEEARIAAYIEIAKKLGIDVETIDYWFRHDKCYISYFFRIAKFTGLKLKIDIRPIRNRTH